MGDAEGKGAPRSRWLWRCGCWRQLLIPLALVVLSMAYSLEYVLRVPASVPPVLCRGDFAGLCGTSIAAGAPAAAASKGEFPVGRWTEPAQDLRELRRHGSATQRFLGLKTWSYVSLSTPEYFLAITPVQLNYIEDVYVSVVHKASGSMLADYHWQFPFGRSLKIAPTSVTECTKFVGWGSERMDICFVGKQWHVSLKLGRIEAKFTINKGKDALALWFPLGGSPARPAYVHKEAGMKAQGALSVLHNASATHSPEVSHRFTDAAATIDWTLALALRETRWRWVSLSCAACAVSVAGAPEEQAYVGINLSKFVYDVVTSGTAGSRVQSASAENAVWVNHGVHPLNVEVAVDVPEHPDKDPWRVHARDDAAGVLIDLTFVPHGMREDHTGSDMIGIVSDFVQPYGAFSGTVAFKNEAGAQVKVAFADVYGVCENHRAVW